MRFRRRFGFTSILLVTVVFIVSLALVCAQESSDSSSHNSGEIPEEASGSTATVINKSDSSNRDSDALPKESMESSSSQGDDNWGHFYDPKNVFCGKFDCYKILGFDHETWGYNPPSLKDITKSYRSLSRKWHPDKNRVKGAREKFVAIAKAYEVLTDSKKRADYDRFRDRPDEYFKKYGSSVLWSYAPKSDASFIIVIFLIAGSAFTYYAQKSKWQTIANHLIKAAVEDLSHREGGSTESIEIREKALAILAEKKKERGEVDETNNGVSGGDRKKKVPKIKSKEKKEKEWEELRPICVELVNEINDFGAGFRKPTWQDLLVVRMIKWPFYLLKSVFWWTKFATRRLRKIELDDQEKEVLTKNAVGEVTWVAVSDDERKRMLTLDLWKDTDALVEWREEHDMKVAGLSANRRKQIKKMRKRGSEDDLHMD